MTTERTTQTTAATTESAPRGTPVTAIRRIALIKPNRSGRRLVAIPIEPGYSTP